MQCGNSILSGPLVDLSHFSPGRLPGGFPGAAGGGGKSILSGLLVDLSHFSLGRLPRGFWGAARGGGNRILSGPLVDLSLLKHGACLDLVERFLKMYINNGINDTMKFNSHFQIPTVYILTRQYMF